jgi:3',5'-cyclic AMP phosphodiesterase CpdA
MGRQPAPTLEPNGEIVAQQHDEQAAAQTPTGTAEVRIVHLSDLHFGRGFNRTLWSNLSRILAKTNPHLIIVTGDLVNSPFRWTLQTARTDLEALARSVTQFQKPEAAPKNLVVIPGNHDVRILGIIPLRWMKWLLPVVFLLVYGMLSLIGLLISKTEYGWKLIGSFSVVVALVVARAFCFSSFRSEFEPYLLTKPTHWTDLGVAIYPFDSASRGVSWARGRIGEAQFDNAQRELEPRSLVDSTEARTYSGVEPRYRIAILHHHPLPIPYDSGQEPLMVMEDAGAFLSEISNQRIPLVLHGHKHHRHFSRVMINAGENAQFEAGVLATGSATAGKRPTRFGFNFNLINIEADRNARVVPYIAAGGTFKEAEPFWVQEPEESAARIFAAAANQFGFSGQSIVALVHVNSDGDSHHVFECRGFKISKGAQDLIELPYPITAAVGVRVGRVERLNVQPLAPNLATALSLRRDAPSSPREQSGTVEFGRPRTCHDLPLNYSWSYHGINSYAMSSQQHYEMYGVGAPTESAQVTLTGCPYAELVMIVNFPRNFVLEGDPELLVTDVASRRYASEVAHRLHHHLFYSKQINVLFLRIPHPPLGLTYKVRWRLASDQTLKSDGAAKLGMAHEINRWLLERSLSSQFQPSLHNLLQAIEIIARKHFGLATPDEDPIDISLMAYDSDERHLKLVAATFPIHDERWDLRLGYGEGIAGRAYKLKKTRLFIKQRAVLEGAPFYFVPLDGGVVSSTGNEIADEVVLSFSLRHPEQPDAVYAVFSLSSKTRTSKLMELTEEELATQTMFENFRQAVEVACFQAIKEAMVIARTVNL